MCSFLYFHLFCPSSLSLLVSPICGFFSLRLLTSEENIVFSDVFVQLRLESLTVNKGRFPWEWCRWKALLALTLKRRGGASFKMSISSKLGSGCKTQVAYFAVLLQSASYCAFFFPKQLSLPAHTSGLLISFSENWTLSPVLQPAAWLCERVQGRVLQSN